MYDNLGIYKWLVKFKLTLIETVLIHSRCLSKVSIEQNREQPGTISCVHSVNSGLCSGLV